MAQVHVRIIERLLADNDRLARECRAHMEDLARQAAYWHDLYQDAMLSGKDENS